LAGARSDGRLWRRNQPRVQKGATAFVHRNALFSCQYVASWNPGEGAGPHLNWVRGTRTAMRPYVSGFAYQNYIDPESSTGSERTTARTTAGSRSSSGVTIRETSSASGRASHRTSSQWTSCERVESIRAPKREYLRGLRGQQGPTPSLQEALQVLARESQTNDSASVVDRFDRG